MNWVRYVHAVLKAALTRNRYTKSYQWSTGKSKEIHCRVHIRTTKLNKDGPSLSQPIDQIKRSMSARKAYTQGKVQVNPTAWNEKTERPGIYKEPMPTQRETKATQIEDEQIQQVKVVTKDSKTHEMQLTDSWGTDVREKSVHHAMTHNPNSKTGMTSIGTSQIRSGKTTSSGQ